MRDKKVKAACQKSNGCFTKSTICNVICKIKLRTLIFVVLERFENKSIVFLVDFFLSNSPCISF